MVKILHFPKSNTDTPIEFIEETKGIVSGEDVISVLVAFKLSDGTVMTGYHKCDFGTRQELVGHIQCDIIDQMILANEDRY